MKKELTTTLITIMSIWLTSAWGSTTTASTKSTATLSATCMISADNLSFGPYNPSQGDVFSAANIKTKCTKGTTYGIGLTYNDYVVDNSIKYAYAVNGGSKWISTLTNAQNGDKLKFNIFQDSAHTQIFGNAYTSGTNWGGNGSGVSVYKVGTGSDDTTTMYGAMPAAQYVSPGNYSVNITASVYY